MKRYEINIRPLSGFGTPMKGDTIFGHFCWQVAYDAKLAEGGIEEVLEVYPTRPFVIFSSAFLKVEGEEPRYVMKRPDMPLSRLVPFDGQDRKASYDYYKEQKLRQWVVIGGDWKIEAGKALFLSTAELETRYGLVAGCLSPQAHNTINRLVGGTGTGAFAPYEKENLHYGGESILVIMVCIDEGLTSLERVLEGLRRIGRFGYGRDASLGLGRFELVGEPKPLAMPDATLDSAVYTLAPCVPDAGDAEELFFTPFVRFGKHGDWVAGSRQPFKNPVLMADEGAVFIKKKGRNAERGFVGKALEGVSRAQARAVVQGYAPFIPVILERRHD